MGTRNIIACLSCIGFLIISGCSGRKPSYSFDGKISEEVLNNYLDRSVTMAELLTVDPFCIDDSYPHKKVDLDFIRRSGVKFIGRAIYRWGHEQAFNDPAGHLQMPSSRVVTLPAPGRRQIVCRVVPPSEDIPYGMDIDSTIIDLWNSDK